ncbi:MAG: polyprenyl synthetase family protein [Planctomycetota bacterium]
MPAQTAPRSSQQKGTNLSVILHTVVCEIAIVEKRVAAASQLQKELSSITPAVKHIVTSKGKYLRPALVLLSCAACGCEPAKAVEHAALTELIHLGSLVFDDLLDGSTIRRGRETVNSKWSNETALLTAARVYLEVVNRTAHEKESSRDIMVKTVNRMFTGEVLQFGSHGKTNITEKEYLTIITEKSASLFSACCQLGAIAAEADENTVTALKKYGLNLGIAFQIMDDLLNIFADEKKLGKRVGSDIEDARLTLPIIELLHKLPNSDRKRLKKMLKNNDNSIELTELRKMIKETGVYDSVVAKARKYTTSAVASVKNFNNSQSLDSLLSLCEFVVLREY